MPIPWLLAGVAAGAVGAGGHMKARENNEKAKMLARDAQRIYDRGKTSLEKAQNNTEEALLKLGGRKKNVLGGSVRRFLSAYDRIKDVQIRQSRGIDEISSFSLGKQDTIQLRELSDIYSGIVSNGATAATTGAIVALAASGSIPVVTGTLSVAGSMLALGQIGSAVSVAGSALSYAAVSPLAAIAAPVVLFTGISANMKAEENLEKARTMYAEANAAAEKMKVSETLCRGITERAEMFDSLLSGLDEIFSECVDTLDSVTENIVQRCGNGTIRAEDLTERELELIAVSRALAGAVKAVIDTPILLKNGGLSEDALAVYDKAAKSLPDFSHEVKRLG